MNIEQRRARLVKWTDRFLALGIAFLIVVAVLDFTGDPTVTFYIAGTLGILSCLVSLTLLVLSRRR